MKQKSYDLIISIGQGCSTPEILRNISYRNFAGPLDWTFMDNYLDGINILKSRFENYFQKNDLEFLYYDNKTLTEIYLNKVNHIRHVHYFPSRNLLDFDTAYQKVNALYERRIKRFLDFINTKKSPKILLLYIERAFDDEYEENENAKIVKVTNNILEKDIDELNKIYNKKCFDILYVKHDKCLKSNEFFFDKRILHINNFTTGDYKLCKGNYKLIEKILRKYIKIRKVDYIKNSCKNLNKDINKLFIILKIKLW